MPDPYEHLMAGAVATRLDDATWIVTHPAVYTITGRGATRADAMADFRRQLAELSTADDTNA